MRLSVIAGCGGRIRCPKWDPDSAGRVGTFDGWALGPIVLNRSACVARRTRRTQPLSKRAKSCDNGPRRRADQMPAPTRSKGCFPRICGPLLLLAGAKVSPMEPTIKQLVLK